MCNRMASLKCCILFALLILFMGHPSQAKLNLFLSQREVRRLLGLSAELYYVREGVINEYALNFVVPVPAHISELHFTWQALGDKPLPYSMDVNVSNAMTPHLNISSVGLVPTKMQTFRLALPCSGLPSAEVDVILSLNVTLSKTARDITPLVFRRRKICLQEDNPAPSSPDDGSLMDDNGRSRPIPPAIQQQEVTTSSPTAAMGFYIGIGCACGFVAAVVTLTLAVYVRNRKRRHHQQSYIEAGGIHPGQGTAFLQRVETPDGFPAAAGSHKSHSSSCGSSAFVRRMTPAVYSVPAVLPPPPPVPQPPHQQHSFIRMDHNHQPVIPNYSTLDSRITNATSTTMTTKDVKEKVQELLVDRSRIHPTGVAQEGTFGRLLYAVFVDEQGQDQEVYVKTVTDQASSMQLSMMLQEGLNLYGANHRNINSIVALCQPEMGPPLLIYPFEGYTNLKRFLFQYKSTTVAPSMTLTTQAIVDMALQTVVALQYLHRRKILHKDIAARNCLVNDQLKIKLCDTALSRDLFPGDYHCLGDNENRPIKWMALESITHKEYSWASDVWMFGVMLWELTTLAQQPYLEVDPFEMSAYLRDGYRLAQPLNCPDELFAVMAYTWAMSIDDRPTLSQLNAYLTDFYSHLNRYV